MNVAIIPLRKRSKGIPGKNKKKLLGRPLFSWVLYEAALSNLDFVYIYTDDKDIITYVEQEYAFLNKVKVLNRSEESASDTASTESAMKEFINKVNEDFTTLTLIQATSPLLTANVINNSLVAVLRDGYDSALTVSPMKRFFWSKEGKPLNYDYKNRPRRQELTDDYVENGACYTVSKEQWEKDNVRIGGTIKSIIMPSDTLVEIDEPEDFLVIEQLIKKRLQEHKSKHIDPKLVAFDVDGVFTKGTVTYIGKGEHSKEFSLRDGMGIGLLNTLNILTLVITSENTPIVKHRMDKIKVNHLFMGVKDKYARLDWFLKQNNIEWSQVIYVGDDINDLTNINAAGFGICPNDATEVIKVDTDLILHNNGGEHAVREAIDFIIKLKNRK